MTEEQEEARKQVDHLRTEIAQGQAMKELKDSAGGKELIEYLKMRYAEYVQAAVRESTSYGPACKALEAVLDAMGTSISVGEVAKEHLMAYLAGTPDESY